MLHHGGRLAAIAAQYQSNPSEWLDVSTGISPFNYPVGTIPEHAWHRLPEEEDGLLEAAQRYYGFDSLLPVAGSQAAIQALPEIIEAKLGRKGKVLLPSVGYQEHRYAWQKQDWQIEEYIGVPAQQQLANCDALLVINPNNPSTLLLSEQQLNTIEQTLPSHAVMIIDEAFMDEQPQASRLSYPLSDHSIVLRSIGKFFGLAGARVGFVAAAPCWLEPLQVKLGPWTICGASRWVVTQALNDTKWQQSAKQQIAQASLKQSQAIQALFTECRVTSAGLFIRLETKKAVELHQALCQQKILARLCDEADAVRFGLCADEQQLSRLISALSFAKYKVEGDVIKRGEGDD
ncbi:threonine-phosphate decarboxylase [Vibrio intestinalis]|uniref:threonine-phosphate decarboxylase n=1 Tax=Vibrio intestinalis TaxID=2933291 RepID=UPI0021A6B1F4|nr:threonine-phosphate decarboxylase [Vibrio intestinalis]